MKNKRIKFKEEGIKLVSLYKQCLKLSVNSGIEELFITDILATVYICNNLYLSCEPENVRQIKRLITDIDSGLTSLYFKYKEGSKEVNSYGKEIASKIRELEKFILKVCNEK